MHLTHKKILLFSFTFIILGTIIYDLFISGAFYNYYNLKKRCYQMATDNNAIREKNNKLQNTINAILSRPYYTEKLIREELGLVKSGEILFEIKLVQ